MIPQVGRQVKDPCSAAIHPKVVTLLKDAASAATNQLQGPLKEQLQDEYMVATLNSSKTEACVRANNGIEVNLVNRFVEQEKRN